MDPDIEGISETADLVQMGVLARVIWGGCNATREFGEHIMPSRSWQELGDSLVHHLLFLGSLATILKGGMPVTMVRQDKPPRQVADLCGRTAEQRIALSGHELPGG